MTRALRTAIAGIVIAVCTAAVLALLLAAIRRAPETYPWGDTATTSIYTLRAARGELATGAYSRFHWNHPGPLLYQMLAPLYALSGRREISLKWMMLALNLGTLAWLLTTVRRRAPMLAATVALALAPLLYREQRLLFWAWNPIVPLLPLALTVALSAVVAAGSVVPLPLLCAVMSVIVQSHVGFAPVMFVLLTSAVALLAAHARRGEVSSTLTDVRRSVGLSAVVIAALWAVPIGHEIETWPGNLARMAQFFRAHAPERQASATVLGVWANQVIGPFAPAWELTTAAASERAPWPVIVLAAIQLPLLAVVSVRAFRRGAAYEASFAALCLVALCAGWFAVLSIVGPVSDYLVVWVAVIGALSVAAITAEALHAARPGFRLGSHQVFVATLVYLIVVAAVSGTRLTSKHAADARSTVVHVFARDLQQYCRAEGIERPMVGFSWPAWEIATGVLLQFYKQEWPIAVGDDMLYLVGEPFRSTGREAGEFYLMPQSETELPPGVTRHVWLTTLGAFRLIRLFRDGSASPS